MKRLTWALWSLMLFFGMGTAFAEDDQSVPKLTLSAENITIQAGGSAVFSCTMDPQGYTPDNGKGKLSFAMRGKQFDDVEKLEYQVGGEVNPDGWLLYGDEMMESLVDPDAFGAAIPNNEDNTNPRVCNIASGARTVHYRLTLKEEASEMPEILFVVANTAFSGLWSAMNAEDDPLATATVNFTLGSSPTPVVAPEAPTFNPDGGEVEAGTKVILTNGTESDATPKLIYYNTKNAEAAESAFGNIKTKADLEAEATQPSYLARVLAYPSAGITVNSGMYISAATADFDAAGNVIWSEIITKNFTIATAAAPDAPVFNPDGGTVMPGQKITLTADEDIYYCLNGSEENFTAWETSEDLGMAESMGVLTMYEASVGITLSESATVLAAAVRFNDDESLVWSEIVTKSFTVTGEAPETVAKPVITPANDAIVHMGDMVTITCGTDEAKIYYTTDGTPATAQSTEYTAPFALTEAMLKVEGEAVSLRIRAIAVKGDVTSEPSGAGYVVYPNAPEFSPVAGEVEANTAVTITCVPAIAKIYYTVDGTEPTMEEGTLYAEAIKIDKDMTVKAIAVLGQYQSAVMTAAYTVKANTPDEPETVAKPTFNPAAGAVVKGTKVSVACETEGAVIYYTVDGSEPTAESTEYKEAIEINEALTLKAIAVKGESKSEVAEAAYTIDKTANEDLELAGVSVYPNPSDGQFNIELPVAATVEVFMSNGMLYQRVRMSEGHTTLNIDRSGIYFFRITGEGRTVIKRVIVR